MSEHRAHILWKNENSEFAYETFDRTHSVTYPGGISIKASSAPEFAGKAEYTNPEEMLAASLASCHMLTFLAICSKSKIVVNQYEDSPVATLEKNEDGKMGITHVTLNPKVVFENVPPADKIKSLHDMAHKNCFIANSVKCKVAIEPQD